MTKCDRGEMELGMLRGSVNGGDKRSGKEKSC